MSQLQIAYVSVSISLVFNPFVKYINQLMILNPVYLFSVTWLHAFDLLKCYSFLKLGNEPPPMLFEDNGPIVTPNEDESFHVCISLDFIWLYYIS